MDNLTIRIASHEEWIEYEKECRGWVEKRNPESIPHMISGVEQKEEIIGKLKEKFPYTAVLEGFEPYHDFASRWCWANVGECNGKCYDHQSDYPACPLVLATKVMKPYSYKMQDGTVVNGKSPDYSDPGEHSHDGNWATVCLTKSGYDCFYIEYLFQSEQIRDRFLVAVPSFVTSYDENFNQDEEEN